MSILAKHTVGKGGPDKVFKISGMAKARAAEVGKENIVNATTGEKTTYMRVVPVVAEGVDATWSLASCAHNVEIVSNETAMETINVAPTKIADKSVNTAPTDYDSPVSGTACLVRKGDVIVIAYRRGKNKDRNTLNRVCISDTVKQQFFKECKEIHGPTYNFVSGEARYDYWNEFMDNEFIRQAKMLMQQ